MTATAGASADRWIPRTLNQMIERGVKHLAVDIEATPEQTTKLVEIAQSAANDLRPLRDQLRDARKQGRELLSAPTLDRAQIETFRAQQMAVADQISKRVSQAIGDAAEVLTPERAKVGDRSSASATSAAAGLRWLRPPRPHRDAAARPATRLPPRPWGRS